MNPLIYGRHDRLSNDAIEQLVRIVLLENYFIFENKVYRIRRGCPINLKEKIILQDYDIF